MNLAQAKQNKTETEKNITPITHMCTHQTSAHYTKAGRPEQKLIEK